MERERERHVFPVFPYAFIFDTISFQLQKSSRISLPASNPTATKAGFPVAKPAAVVVAHTAHKTEYFAYFPPHISSNMPAVYVVALTGFENFVTFLAVFIYLRPGYI